MTYLVEYLSVVDAFSRAMSDLHERLPGKKGSPNEIEREILLNPLRRACNKMHEEMIRVQAKKQKERPKYRF